jgi:hypothetical protein
MHPSELYRPRYFRLAPAYRRCAVYLLVGMVLVACLLHLVGAFVRRQPGFHGEAPGELIGGTFLVVLLVAPAILILRWKMRVDERGIARRRLWGWDLWPWEAFQDGSGRA